MTWEEIETDTFELDSVGACSRGFLISLILVLRYLEINLMCMQLSQKYENQQNTWGPKSMNHLVCRQWRLNGLGEHLKRSFSICHHSVRFCGFLNVLHIRKQLPLGRSLNDFIFRVSKKIFSPIFIFFLTTCCHSNIFYGINIDVDIFYLKNGLCNVFFLYCPLI